MNFDRFAVFVCFSFLPILWLPMQWLSIPCYIAMALIGYAILKRNCALIWLAIVIFASYSYISNIANKADHQVATKTYEKLEVTRLLKQQNYQSAIAKRENGDLIYLNWQAKTPLYLEAIYQAELNFYPISARSNQGNFDQQRWYFSQHLIGKATVRKATLLNNAQSSLRHDWLMRSQQQTKHLPTQGLLLALAFGERAWLTAEDWKLFQQTSTAHLVAISGLHIGLAFAFGFWCAKLLQWCFLRVGCRLAIAFNYSVANIIGLIFAFGYSYLAGFAIPTVRALIAIILVLSCRYCRCYYTAWQLWWRIVAILLVLDPLAILSDSFWLSILAVLSLIIWYQYFPLTEFIVQKKNKKLPKFYRLLLSLAHLQLGILCVFAPVQYYFFEGLSAVAFITNLLIVPYYSFLVVPLILISLLTNNFFHTWQLTDQLIQGSLTILNTASTHWFWLSQSQQWQLLIGFAGLLVMLYGIFYAKSKWFWWQSAGLILVSVLFHLFIFSSKKIEWITFDVGQGLAQAFVYQQNGQNKAIFYDTGVSWGASGNSMASLEILPYLRRHNIEVEAIFLSHDDRDHAGGIPDLLAAYPNARLISSSAMPYANKMPEACIAGKQWQFNQLIFRTIYPTKLTTRSKNADSCIIIVEIDRFRILLTGDATAQQESIIAPSLTRIDFLQVPHHGSKTSSSQALLAKIKPYLAIASVGRWNPWRMPHPRVVERFEQYNIPLVTTATDGMIKVIFEHNTWEVITNRNKFSAWYRQLYATSAKQ